MYPPPHNGHSPPSPTRPARQSPPRHPYGSAARMAPPPPPPTNNPFVTPQQPYTVPEHHVPPFQEVQGPLSTSSSHGHVGPRYSLSDTFSGSTATLRDQGGSSYDLTQAGAAVPLDDDDEARPLKTEFVGGFYRPDVDQLSPCRSFPVVTVLKTLSKGILLRTHTHRTRRARTLPSFLCLIITVQSL